MQSVRNDSVLYRVPWSPGESRPAPPLWRPEDVLRSMALITAGFVMCAVGWYLASGETNYRHQIGPANLALGGLIVAGIGHVVWAMRGRRAIAERRRRLLGEPALVPLASNVSYERTQSSVIVAGEGMRHYHRSDCPLAVRRPWPSGPADVQEAAGREPCGVCQP